MEAMFRVTDGNLTGMSYRPVMGRVRTKQRGTIDMNNTRQRPIPFILSFYFICFLFRAVEYLVIRTDQGFFGEAFIHKMIGILLLAVAVQLIPYRWSELGFKTEKCLRDTGYGLLLGCAVFVVAYSVEIMILAATQQTASLRFFATSYAVQGNRELQSGLLLILICIAGNIINVVMEEGVFRGLFIRLGREKYSFLISCLISSLLFGFWHIAQPVRNAMDGIQSVPGAIMMGLMLVVTSTLGGIQYAMLTEMTGSIWTGMAAHFINNTSANLLHVVTETGIDELMSIRITIAQTLSCVLVFILFLLHLRAKKRTSANGERLVSQDDA